MTKKDCHNKDKRPMDHIVYLRDIYKHLTRYSKDYACMLVKSPYYLPLKTGLAFSLNKLEFPSPKDAFAMFGWNWPIVSGEMVFKCCYYAIMSPWKRVCPFIFTNLNSLLPKTLFASPSGSKKKFFLKCEKFTDRQMAYNQRRLLELSAKTYLSL